VKTRGSGLSWEFIITPAGRRAPAGPGNGLVLRPSSCFHPRPAAGLVKLSNRRAGQLVDVAETIGSWHTGVMDTATVDREATINARCAALGLTRAQAQALADTWPFPYNVAPHDLPFMLGLDSATLAPRPPKNWLAMAAHTASCSYKGTLTPEVLLSVLVTGEVPAEFTAHIICFLDEVWAQAVVLGIEQAAQLSGVPISEIWRNVTRLNESLRTSSRRPLSVCENTNVTQFE
jgi:hypothetical protein